MAAAPGGQEACPSYLLSSKALRTAPQEAAKGPLSGLRAWLPWRVQHHALIRVYRRLLSGVYIKTNPRLASRRVVDYPAFWPDPNS